MILPICAVCNKPVERMEHREDNFRATLIYTVYCHGEEESGIVDQFIKTSAELTRTFENRAALTNPTP